MRLSGFIAICAAGILALSACAPSDVVNVSVITPTTRGSSPIALPSNAEATWVGTRLEGLGLRVTQIGANFVTAEGGAESALVDCGQIRQTALGNRSSAPGTAETLTIYTSADPLEVIVRQMRYQSYVRIDLADGMAQISEIHRIAVRWQAGDGTEFRPALETISLGETVTFADGTVCTTTGRVSRALG